MAQPFWYYAYGLGILEYWTEKCQEKNRSGKPAINTESWFKISYADQKAWKNLKVRKHVYHGLKRRVFMIGLNRIEQGFWSAF